MEKSFNFCDKTILFTLCTKAVQNCFQGIPCTIYAMILCNMYII